MNGVGPEGRRRQETVGGHELLREGARPRKVAPWPWNKASWTPWNWDETLDQYQTFRKVKSQI